MMLGTRYIAIPKRISTLKSFKPSILSGTNYYYFVIIRPNQVLTTILVPIHLELNRHHLLFRRLQLSTIIIYNYFNQ